MWFAGEWENYFNRQDWDYLGERGRKLAIIIAGKGDARLDKDAFPIERYLYKSYLLIVSL